MIINNLPNFLETGFDFRIVDSSNKILYKPVNPNPLDKNDVIFKYDNIEDYFIESFTIEPNTYDILKIWDRINFLNIKVSNKANIIPAFNLKLEQANGQVLNLNEFIHLQFSEGISKFYISNPTSEPQVFEILYIKSKFKGDKILNNYFKKTDTLLDWNIKHNLGYAPNFIFIGNEGEILEPEYVLEISNNNQLYLKFEIPYQGFIYLYKYFNYEQTIYVDQWIIEHNLNSMPNILVLDTNGAPITQYEVTYFDTNKIILTFENPRAGKVLLY